MFDYIFIFSTGCGGGCPLLDWQVATQNVEIKCFLQPVGAPPSGIEKEYSSVHVLYTVYVLSTVSAEASWISFYLSLSNFSSMINVCWLFHLWCHLTSLMVRGLTASSEEFKPCLKKQPQLDPNLDHKDISWVFFLFLFLIDTKFSYMFEYVR